MPEPRRKLLLMPYKNPLDYRNLKHMKRYDLMSKIVCGSYCNRQLVIKHTVEKWEDVTCQTCIDKAIHEGWLAHCPSHGFMEKNPLEEHVCNS